jgi:hypothetical protein
MISKLGKIMTKFPGTANQTHCFAHTLSISAKAILKQFEIPKKKKERFWTRQLKHLVTWLAILILKSVRSERHGRQVTVMRKTRSWTPGSTFMRD